MKKIRKQLAIATCTLLSHGAHQADAGEWTTDTSFLSYAEADDRVSVKKLINTATSELGDDDTLKLDVVYDTMSGATPTGAVKSSNIVSVTTPSGSSGFSAGGGSTYLAPFEDTRLGVGASWIHNVSRTLRATSGANISIEGDYESYGISATVDKDTADRIVTYTAGISGAYDYVRQRSGLTPEPLAEVTIANFYEEGEKSILDVILGVNRVLNRNTQVQLNYSAGILDGYLNDPYKVISRVDSNDIEIERYFENRPDHRTRQSVYTALAHKLKSGNVLHLSYRYFWDDWEVTSHTLDYRQEFALAPGKYLEPHVRLYNQSAASFFHHGLLVGDPLPEYASADYRLDEMNGITLGIKYGVRAWAGGHLRTRIEYIYQDFAESAFDTNKAVVIQLSYKKDFD